MITITIDDNPGFLSKPETGIAASIGFFDGVHRGHRFLIDQLKKTAAKLHLPSAVITFPVHPRMILNAEYQPELLNSFEEKMDQLSTTGIDYCFVLEFNEALSNFTAKEFIQEKLAREFNVKALLIGYDHKFGKGRVDGFDEYRKYGEECGIEVVQARSLTERDIHISSTAIRNLLAEGNVKQAASILTYNYTLDGIVINGNKLGREMGFPTANIKLFEQNKIIPQSGIYATWAYIGDKKYMGMAYIGTRPSFFARGEQRIEVHLLNFSGDLYDKELKLEFVDHIRDDIKFEFVDDLKDQLMKDREDTIELLS